MALFGGRKKNKDAQPTAQTAGSGNVRGEAAEVSGSPSDNGPPQFSEKDISNASKWFQQAAKLTGDRNYDYAIECFLTGLRIWPEAVEEGHQPLRAAAYARRETGGKKASKIEAMKHPTSGKDAIQCLINAEWRWARDPSNMSHMQSMVKNATKARLERTLLFIAPIYFDAAKGAKKLAKDPFLLLRKSYEEMGQRCEERGDLKRAIDFYQGAVTVLDLLRSLTRTTMEFDRELTDLATKVTIIKGRYDSGEDFRSSVKDSEAQKDIHDRERMVMDESRLDELIDEAREKWKANPTVTAKLLNLVDLLCRGEDPERERQATALLDDEHAASGNYSYKARADDIRMKQLRREVRRAAADGDKQTMRKAQTEQLKFELKTFKNRIEKYPTDNKLKFEYGKRLLQARRYDEAIPMLQEARNDPKNRITCMFLIGRCFYERGFHSQSIATFNQAIEEHELIGDDLAKALHYWLGRTCEAADKKDEAVKAFGQVIQWDYNYKDVRDRLAVLEE